MATVAVPAPLITLRHRPWALVTLRAGRRPVRMCWVQSFTVELKPGMQAYRPMHNRVGRWMRMCVKCGASMGTPVEGQ